MDLFGEPRSAASGALIRPFLAAGVTADAAEQQQPTGPALRPFLLTSGRVAARESIAIETQVVATDLGRATGAALAFEQRDIVTLCACRSWSR